MNNKRESSQVKDETDLFLKIKELIKMLLNMSFVMYGRFINTLHQAPVNSKSYFDNICAKCHNQSTKYAVKQNSVCETSFKTTMPCCLDFSGLTLLLTQQSCIKLNLNSNKSRLFLISLSTCEFKNLPKINTIFIVNRENEKER